MSFWRMAVMAAGLMVPTVAQAKTPPNADRIRSAADEFDAGRRAFNDGKYDEAAVHFENAFHDAPAPAALRNAIASRQQAGHLSRAAVLAALALSKYPGDAATKDIATTALGEAAPKLYKVSLACAPACSVASNGKVMSLEDAMRIVFYLDPGEHEVVIGWSDDRARVVRVHATAGGATELNLDAPPPKPSAPAGTAAAGVGTVDGPPLVVEAPSRKPFGPWLFVVGSVLTVGAGIATVASGVDTLNNPGTGKVTAGCVGLGESCALYQQGLASQTRTNVLVGVTAGVGALTAVVGLFLTQWSSPAGPSARASSPAAASGSILSRRGWVRPTFSVAPSGGAVGLAGAF